MLRLFNKRAFSTTIRTRLPGDYLGKRAEDPATMEKSIGERAEGKIDGTADSIGGKTPGNDKSAFHEDGAIGKEFKKDGKIGSLGEKVGGPFASDGAVGKNFNPDGAVGGTVNEELGGKK